MGKNTMKIWWNFLQLQIIILVAVRAPHHIEMLSFHFLWCQRRNPMATGKSDHGQQGKSRKAEE